MTQILDGNGDLIIRDPTPPIHNALAAILDSLGPIAKDGTAPGNMGGYKFRRVEDITAALKPLFAKHGVICLPNVGTRIESQRSTSKGGVLFCVDLEITFDFVGPAGDMLSATVWGQGTDSGDKATQKAVTSAFKTMLSVVFCISDSESDAEAHDVPETARRVPASKDRIEACKALILERDLTDWIKAQGYEWPWNDEQCGWIELYAANQPGRQVKAAEGVTTREESKEEAWDAPLDKLACAECGQVGGLHLEGCTSVPF